MVKLVHICVYQYHMQHFEKNLRFMNIYSTILEDNAMKITVKVKLSLAPEKNGVKEWCKNHLIPDRISLCLLNNGQGRPPSELK